MIDDRGENVDTLIIGSGFAGATVARILAERGEKVKIIEKRPHIGGNCYDEYDEYGILVHKYGPHIFHTNDQDVFEFLSRFTSWYDYQHEVVGNVYGKIIPIPFNLNTLMIVFGEEKGQALKQELIDTYGENARVPILELQKSSSQGIQEVAQYVYENIFLKYTMKQWNQKPEEVDQSVTARVPVLISYDNRYFQDKYQGMPKDGYTKLFERMLDHENIDIELSKDAKEDLTFDFENHKIYYLNQEFKGKIIFTGAIDEFFDNRLGQLPYRSLRFDFEHYPQDYYQSKGVVNYTVSEDYTRITEFKYLTGQLCQGTTIIKEYPEVYKDNRQVPYYAILNPENIMMHQKYVDLMKPFENFYLLGRLAQYKYYNIDGIVKAAIDLTKQF
ncbi:MAG: UDP-galactopyranose mutase [Longibaculum muris]|uniref:UDP-galactopyranose mutase n=1 Tax=Longibaculum muris TaxID=1796628 RepID=A0A4R3ZA87_9FIRM|nr:UDP-galactopyranose mutase [Longibaculum muris]KXU45725.1 UDP-galactopyranose mutase [Candidatus Stoquefichus sp. KLE1796]MCR1886563.1 UDP-galactopyranose mutase [Longibaculum muris]MED9813038.1 UDP-galactopyranose mutase [Longibaculum muris]TCW01616.1 UDP-galactopyranose mutase [Longibaculum muris]